MKTKIQTAKVVINRVYGGFSLSNEAVREYLHRIDVEWTEEEYHGLTIFSIVGDDEWTDRGISRTDPVLIALVEEWGDRANGTCAGLEIVEVPKGTHYRIDEYDGLERIETRDGIDWRIA